VSLRSSDAVVIFVRARGLAFRQQVFVMLNEVLALSKGFIERSGSVEVKHLFITINGDTFFGKDDKLGTPVLAEFTIPTNISSIPPLRGF